MAKGLEFSHIDSQSNRTGTLYDLLGMGLIEKYRIKQLNMNS